MTQRDTEQSIEQQWQAGIHARRGEQPPQDWQLFIEEGRMALESGEPQLASQYFVQALDLGYDLLYSPNSGFGVSYETALSSVVLALLNLVESYLAEGRSEMALVRLNRCVSLLANQSKDAGHEGIRICVHKMAARLAEECPQLLGRIQSNNPALQAMVAQLGVMVPKQNRMALH